MTDASAWQPIETAPKDGTEIIVCFSNDYGWQKSPTVYGPYTAKYYDGEWMASWDGGLVIDAQSDCGTWYKSTDIEPTHWQPLPLPPNTGGE